MDKDTKQRLDEIRAAIKKYGFDEILGQTAKSKICRSDDENEESSTILMGDEIPVKLRLMLQELGTTFIKLGQLLSTRPDVVGENIANELANLRMTILQYPMNRLKQLWKGNLTEILANCSKTLHNSIWLLHP